MVADGTGEDLAGTSAFTIDEHHQRNSPGAGPMSRVIVVFQRTAAASGNNHAVIDKLVGYFNAGGEQTAGVTPQVDDQAPHAFAMQFPESRVQIATGRLLEARELEISD